MENNRISVKQMDPIVVSFGDALLRASDMKILSSKNGWLGDRILGFMFEYWEKEQFQQYKNSLALITPDVVQLIKMSSVAELELILEPLSLRKKALIIMVINDNNSRDSPGGSHWSVLSYSAKDNSFRHFDSSGHMNMSSAVQCAKKISTFVKGRDKGGDLPAVQVLREPSPQQTNGWDCGVYAACFAEYLINRTFSAESRPIEQAVTMELVQGWRERCRKLAESLISKQEVLQ